MSTVPSPEHVDVHVRPAGHAGHALRAQGAARHAKLFGAGPFVKSWMCSHTCVVLRQKSGPHANVPAGAGQLALIERSTPMDAAAHVLA